MPHSSGPLPSSIKSMLYSGLLMLMSHPARDSMNPAFLGSNLAARSMVHTASLRLKHFHARSGHTKSILDREEPGMNAGITGDPGSMTKNDVARILAFNWSMTCGVTDPKTRKAITRLVLPSANSGKRATTKQYPLRGSKGSETDETFTSPGRARNRSFRSRISSTEGRRLNLL